MTKNNTLRCFVSDFDFRKDQIEQISFKPGAGILVRAVEGRSIPKEWEGQITTKKKVVSRRHC